MGVAPWVQQLPPPRKQQLAPRALNYYRAELRRRDASCRASLAIIIGELSAARARLQAALHQLDLGRLV